MKRTVAYMALVCCVTTAMLVASVSQAAAPSVDQALKLMPIQPGIDYDRPDAQETANCKILPKKIDGNVGWIVENPEGVVLRRFVDTNGDNVVDQWSYFKDGLEVYRDIDSNFNGKADQYRWFHTAGGRWAIDANEDGVIDSWKSISAEEATAEVVAAIASRDAERFARLVLSTDELKSLGLGKKRADGVAEKIAKAVDGFKATSARQKAVARDAEWVQFSANRPGVIPAGADDSTKDLRVYENVVAIVQSADKHAQVQIGTLIQVGDVWRVIDAPTIIGDEQADSSPAGGFFFQASLTHRTDQTAGSDGEALQKLLGELEKLDRDSANAATPDEQAGYNSRRADLLEQIAAAAKNPDDRAMWLRQLADMISAAVQVGAFPNGDDRLQALFDKLQKNEKDKELAGYVKFRQLTAAYVLDMQAPKADYAKIQSEWLKTLEQYIADYPTSSDSAEAMLQLAISEEFSGEEADAKKWYARIVKEFPESAAAKKAAGAQTRLDSVGRQITVGGQTLAGGSADLSQFRGRVVLVQYWATWSAPAKADMAALKELTSKYARSFAVLGVSLDNNVNDLKGYLAENPLPWPQIFEPGGMDSRPANMMGILTVPTMILVDQQGRVVNRNIAASEIEPALKKLIK